MNWWTLLRGIPCSPSEGLDKVWPHSGHKPSNRTGRTVPMGPTWSHLKYGLMMFDDHHCYSLTWIIMRISNLCIAWEMPRKFLEIPGITSLFRSKKRSSCLELHHTFWDDSHHPAAMMEFGDWHFFCLFIGMKSSRITQIDPEKPTDMWFKLE